MAHFREGLLSEGYFRLRFGSLIFGGGRRGLIIGILQYDMYLGGLFINRPCYTRQFFLQLVSQRRRLKNIASCRGGVTRSQYCFSTCSAPAGNCLQLFLRQLEISCEQKTGFDCLIFTKWRGRLRWTRQTQQLVSQRCEKLRLFLLFLQLAMQHFVAVARGVTREIFLATCLATFVATQVARKIASCNMALFICLSICTIN